ncbi:MAG: nucleotidyltransferase substrate binding protein [Candidatus Sumerlaeia bacterium]|nr:nucleotidyltransferase substrate binding protein [Candidatus Sumerlaeia bacterium]
MERQAEARASAARLTEACALEKTELVRDAVIQRFEFTFEAVLKALKVYLVRQGYTCGGPRDTLRRAFEEKIVATSEEADCWLAMLEDRNLTSHAYSEPLADRIYDAVVRDHAPLLAAMAERIATLSWD